MTPPYAPKKGDIIWVDFRPTEGHEQNGHRPALVLSPRAYNAKTGLALVCPLASRVKGYPFEVPVTLQATKGAILADQVKSIDWVARKVRFSGSTHLVTAARAQQLLQRLLDS